MIDPRRAFRDGYAGFSIWNTPDGSYQCNLRRAEASAAFTIGVGDSPDDAWDDAWRNSGVVKPKRNVEDLA